MKTKLQIKDITNMTGLDRETLRFYEQKGLLPPASRTESGYRQFEPDVILRIKFIKTAQEVGFTLKEISELLNIGQRNTISKADLRKLANVKIQEIDHKIQSLQTMRNLLDNLSKRASLLTKKSSCPILSQFKNLEI